MSPAASPAVPVPAPVSLAGRARLGRPRSDRGVRVVPAVSRPLLGRREGPRRPADEGIVGRRPRPDVSFCRASAGTGSSPRRRRSRMSPPPVAIDALDSQVRVSPDAAALRGSVRALSRTIDRRFAAWNSRGTVRSLFAGASTEVVAGARHAEWCARRRFAAGIVRCRCPPIDLVVRPSPASMRLLAALALIQSLPARDRFAIDLRLCDNICCSSPSRTVEAVVAEERCRIVVCAAR